jgi:hypothetical protein
VLVALVCPLLLPNRNVGSFHRLAHLDRQTIRELLDSCDEISLALSFTKLTAMREDYGVAFICREL